VATPGGKAGEASPLWVDVQKLCNMCVLSLSWNFVVSHDKYIARPSSKEPRLIHRKYNRDWGTSNSRPPIDPYLTSPLLQNPGGATVSSPQLKLSVCWATPLVQQPCRAVTARPVSCPPSPYDFLFVANRSRSFVAKSRVVFAVDDRECLAHKRENYYTERQ